MKYIFGVFLLICSSQSIAFEDMQYILGYDKKPAGVVIEITSSDALYLKKILPELTADITALRNKFKDIPVAIVSHFKESLILTKKNSLVNPALHKQIKSLSSKDNTDIHVCGTYASWNNVSEEDFPEYINVSPAGPTQVDRKSVV